MTERRFRSHASAWKMYVGDATPEEFSFGFPSQEAAISDFLANWPYPEPVPSWLRGSMVEYMKQLSFDSTEWTLSTAPS